MLYTYLLASAAVGVLSNFATSRWTLPGSLLLVSAGVVVNSLPWIDWRNQELREITWRVATQGTFWYLIPSAVLFSVAFVAGRYGTRFLLHILQPSRGERPD